MKTLPRQSSILFSLIVALAGSVSLANVTEVIHPEFLNELKVGVENLPANQASSMAFHGGNVGPYSAPVDSICGKHLLFDGADDYCQTTQNPNLANQSFTIEAWARRDTNGAMNMIVVQGAGASHEGLMFGFHWDWVGFVFDFYGDGPRTFEVDNAWHHWAGTYNATNRLQCLYRDGVLLETNVAATNFLGSGPLYIGQAPFDNPANFAGAIDDVRIWSVARTQTEIQADMLHRLSGSETGLIAYWQFDENAGATVADTTGHGYDLSLYNGPVWVPGPSSTPNDGNRYLSESSLGQSFATDVPYPEFVLDSILSAQGMLYPPANWSRADIADSDFVFRYKPLLFNTNSGGVAPDPSQITGYFGSNERIKFGVAVKLMHNALKYAPYDRTLRNALLDAYYDLAVAEVQFANVDRAKIAEYRLGFRLPPADGFVIDQEIILNSNLVTRYELALSRYGELLTSRMGVNVAECDASVTNGMPLGAYIFHQEQPFRNQYAAQYSDEHGVLRTVPFYTNDAPRVLFAGYKDYVNLLNLLREYTVSAAELARLCGMRGSNGDVLAALNLIGKIQRETQIEILLLRGMFPGYEPAPGDASGLRSALNGLGVGLAELDNVRAFLDGRKNLLGFDPNFLVLIKEAPDGTTDRFDSYDALMYWIGGRGNPSSFTPLGNANAAYLAAGLSYENYRGNADEVSEQLNQIANTYGDRYYEITGWDPGDTTTNHIIGCRSGSELWQAHRNVELAETRVARIRQQDKKLNETIGEANWVISLASSKSERLEFTKQNYFDSTDSAWDCLHTWRGMMAGSQATFDLAAAVGTVDGIATAFSVGAGVAAMCVAGAGNIAIQTEGAVFTSMAEQDLERAAADYEVAKLNIDIPAEIAQAKIEYQNLLREQIALTLEMEDAKAMQTQEIARRENLLRELEHIKQQADESDANLADRYYADPIHYLRAQSDMILADEAFREAQRWVFFGLRALEYKWNTNFVKTYLGKNWETSSLFKLRNYPELAQLILAMEEFNRVSLLGFNREPWLDCISLRKDVFAPTAGSTNGLWLDVETGDLLTSTNLFRRKLQRLVDSEGHLVINLNTFALKKDNGFFFLGPRYRTNGTVLSAGKYLDKIDWIKFNVVGSHTTTTRDANLSYGGTCYLRTQMPPCGDSANPFQLTGEYRSFPFYYFRTLDNGVTWQTRTAQDDTVKMAFTQTPGEPEPDLQYPNSLLKNHFLKERSVAATAWVLTLPADTFNLNQMDDIEIWIKHQFASREIPDCN